MEPITVIVSALAAGAAAALKPMAEGAIKDAYNGIKSFITKKYGKVDLTPLETKPESENKRASLAEDLTDAGAANDVELLDQAKQVIDAVEKHDPESASAIGIVLREVEAQYLEVRKIITDGTGMIVEKGKFGEMIIGEIDARKGQPPANP
jgi:hypothetical protein